MSNNIIKCNTMIDTEFTKETGIEIESLDTNNKTNISNISNTNKETYLIFTKHNDGRVTNIVVIINANKKEYNTLCRLLNQRNRLVSVKLGFVYHIEQVKSCDISTIINDVKE